MRLGRRLATGIVTETAVPEAPETAPQGDREPAEIRAEGHAPDEAPERPEVPLAAR